MIRTAILASLLMSFSTMTNGQHVLFDEPHPTDGAIFWKVLNGREVMVNISGEVLTVHEVFQMPMYERKAQGLTFGISASETSLMKQEGMVGPTFNLTFLDIINSTGQGFDHPVDGPKRKAVVEAAFAYMASAIMDGGEADIEIRESFSGNPNSYPFAFSGAYYFGSKGFNDPFTKMHITTGSDPYGGSPDAYIQFNFHSGMNFNYDPHGQPQADQYDLYTVVLHEIMHLLGFASYCTAQGLSVASPNVFTSYDGHLIDYQKDPLLEVSGSGSNATVSQPSATLLTNNQLWFDLGQGQTAPVFSPGSFNSSSISHLDNGRTEHAGYVMHPTLGRGQRFSQLHEDEVAILEALGYNMNLSVATDVGDAAAQGPVIGEFSFLYPNPVLAGQAVWINAHRLDASEILVIVYDMLGRESYSKVVLSPSPGPITAIDPYHNLPPGMYVVIGSSKNELFNQKLVIR
jgi:hypothetical protein